MMKPSTRNRLVIGLAVAVASGFLGYQMYHSLTPARHADHDHAIAKLDAGGFLWLEEFGGDRRNMVGAPGHVLVMHFYDPAAPETTEQVAAARFSASLAGDDTVEMLFVAQSPSWDGVKESAEALGTPIGQLYLDEGGRTGDLFGVRRLPETLIYDAKGFLAFQAKGPVDWAGATITAQIERAKGGVEEIH